MKKLFKPYYRILLLTLISVFFISQAVEAGSAKNKTVKIKCTEMTCIGCKKKITESINTLDGVININVSLKTKIIKVTYDDSKTDPNKIIAAITEAGYESELME